MALAASVHALALPVFYMSDDSGFAIRRRSALNGGAWA
jgi:hypothetical protein